MSINWYSHVLKVLPKFGTKYLFFITVALCLLLPARSDCKPIVLKVNNLPDFSSQEVMPKAESAVIRRFLELYPNIQLKKGTGLTMEGSKSMDMVPLMQIAGDISPQVVYVNFRLSDTYIQNGFLKPLDEYIKRAGWTKEEIDRRIPPSMRDVCYREGPDGKKHYYVLPTQKCIRALIYRRDKFEQAGLDPDRPPRTWSEMEEYCLKLADPASGRYGIAFTKGDVSAWDFANLVWSGGADFLTKDSAGNWHPAFNTPDMVNALAFYVRLNKMKIKGKDGRWYRGVAERNINTPITDTTATYAMYFNYLGERLNIYAPEMIAYAPVPRADNGGKSASEINSQMLGLFAGTKDPELAQAAFDYMAFIDSDEANKIRTKLYIQRGYGRFVNPNLLERFGYTDYLKQVDKEWVKVYKDVLVNGKPEPYGRNCALVYQELSRPIEQAINDSKVIAALDRGDEKAMRTRLQQILNQAQTETLKRMFGTIPEPVKKMRYNLTCIFLGAALIGFSTAVGYLFKLFRREAPPQMPGQKNTLVAYLILIPAVLSIAVWQYLPLIRGTLIAFQDYNVMGGSKFIGLQNFATVLFDQGFWHSVGVTLMYTGLYMTFAFIAPIFLALLLTEVPRGKILFRTIFYLPAVLSGLVVIFLWKSFYKPTGLINTVLGYIGIHVNIGWLDVPQMAMIGVLLPVIWAGMGPGCLIYLAALKTIPEEFYEAADIDGAGIIRKVRHITLPGLKMLIMINAVGAFIGAFMTSEMILAMTGGGPYTPYGATEVVGLQLFYTAFMYLKFGVANAMAWVLGFMLIGLTLMQLRNLSRVEFKGGKR
jgi:ABC-type sugar transport system permease subunit/ABC-type glycerol-3-phosphate transport system substrate-binding protein